MSQKIQTIYSCTKCHAQSLKYNGRCLECGGWGTLVEEIKEGKNHLQELSVKAEIIDLKTLKAGNNERLKTGIGEVDRVFGGGFVPGSLILLSGEPGIGKSTIMAQIADRIGDSSGKTAYISGEESALQVKNRLERLHCNLDNIAFIQETNVEKILGALKELKPKLSIIDSIQTVYSHAQESEAGSLNQIRAATLAFLEIAKKENLIIILAGHITKDGQVAGPKTLEHIVDAVINLEAQTRGDFRILRAQKNRFGSVSEIGIFEMASDGFHEVKDPGSVFIDRKRELQPGSVLSSVMEGSRPFLLEIQALVAKTVFGYPQRKASGFDLNRLQVLSAVLSRKAGLNLVNQDIILNVVGGLKFSDPSLDLAVCLAIASAMLGQTIEKDCIVIGEVGLGGELRTVNRLKDRLVEAVKLGFTKAIIPDVDIKISGLVLERRKNLGEMMASIVK